mmetsp:Transcript_29534/g.75170  ORF Transcript_29534/g.75170 Transcript_29534/m.75170 type:complete len:506 (-) Transcript_29534:61-1578(-)
MPVPPRDDVEQALRGQVRGQSDYGAARAEQEVYELADVVEGFGIRAYHAKVLLLSWILQLCPASVVMATPFVLGAIREEYGVNRPMVALVGSAVTLGAVGGVLLFGPLHDHLGRKRANLMAVLGIGMLAVAHVALPSDLEGPGRVQWRGFMCLVGLRFAIGMAFGGAACYALLHFVEFLPSQLRGLMMTVASMGWSLGTLYSIWVASVLGDHWRIVLASPIVACLVAFPALLLGPESPRWLFAVGREQESRAVLGEVVATRRLLSPELRTPSLNHVPERVLLSHSVVDLGKEASVCNDIRALFGPALWRVSLITMLIQASVNGASYVMLIWFPEILTVLLGTRHVPYEFFVYAEVVSAVGTLVSAYAMDKCGRRPTLAVSLFATAATTLALAHVPRTYSWLMATYLLQSFTGSGIWPAMQTYCAECFPTVLRGTGGSLCQGFGRASSVVMPIVVGAILDGKAEGELMGSARIEPALAATAITWTVGAIGAVLIPWETANEKMADS